MAPGERATLLSTVALTRATTFLNEFLNVDKIKSITHLYSSGLNVVSPSGGLRASSTSSKPRSEFFKIDAYIPIYYVSPCDQLSNNRTEFA